VAFVGGGRRGGGAPTARGWALAPSARPSGFAAPPSAHQVQGRRRGDLLRVRADRGETRIGEVGASQLDTIVRSGAAVVLDVYATWCGPCKLLEPTLEALAERFESAAWAGGSSKAEVEVVRLDSDEHPGKASALGVEGLPTVIFFKNGAEVGRFEGVVSLDELEGAAAKMFGMGGLASAAPASSAAQLFSMEGVELAIQTEDALVLGVLAGGRFADDSAALASSLMILRRRLPTDSVTPRIATADASMLAGLAEALELNDLPAVVIFEAGTKLAQIQGKAAGATGPGELSSVVNKLFGE